MFAVAILQVFKRVKFVALWSLKKTIRATGPQLICCRNVYSKQGLQEKSYKADKTALEGACESLKAPIYLAMDVLFFYFFFIFLHFQLFLVYLEK
jgi:hypothetical protein